MLVPLDPLPFFHSRDVEAFGLLVSVAVDGQPLADLSLYAEVRGFLASPIRDDGAWLVLRRNDGAEFSDTYNRY